MSVKGIFKIIIGTIAVIVITSIVLEVFNITTTSLQLNSIAKMSTRQACVFFGQETYKREDAQTVNMSDIYNSEGGNTVSGIFYNGGDAVAIYTNLYTSSTFKTWANTMRGNWQNLDLILDGLNHTGTGVEGLIAQFYAEAQMTPLNLGVPYLDMDVVQRIMRWNLTSVLNNGIIDASTGGFANLHRDATGRDYVEYKGFRVFVNEATIDSIQYRVIDLSTAQGRIDFTTFTNMDPTVITDKTDGPTDERNKVCLAGVSYSVPMQYKGITPLKNIMEFAWNNKVEGTDGVTPTTAVGVWDDNDIATMSGGGFDGNSTAAIDGVLPIPGEFVYYIVR